MTARQRDAIARIGVSIAALLPYWRVVTFSVVLATDDQLISDIFNGELPGRLLVARALRSGHLPLWTSAMCSGYPLAGAPADPIGLALFALLPPAPALDLLVVLILLVAAHGTYSLARRFGADRPAAVLAGFAFAGSGYIATQLRHLSIMSTIAWLPFGLLLIDHLFTSEGRRRQLLLATLGLLYANQVLAGFPQSAYICALVYGAFALFRAIQHRRRFAGTRERVTFVAGFGAVFALGTAAGAIVLLPLAEFARFTDRVAPLNYLWATYTNFWPPNLLTFFIPYINGDATNGTYIGDTPFWENYGYAGAATSLLAIYGAVREGRRPVVAFVIVMTLLAFAFVLGPHTPIFHAAFVLVPGMNHFRAPTRFMVVLDLGLALLGAFGLTRLRVDLERRWRHASRARLAAIAVCAITALDLLVHQSRQNAFVPAEAWLAPPSTAAMIRADSPAPRTFTPQHRTVHRHVHDEHHGWADIEPFYRLRDLLQPDTGGGYWDVPSADCYVGIAPRWYVKVWGYHYDEVSLMSEAGWQAFDVGQLITKPEFVPLLRTYGVTHVLTPFPADAQGLTLLARQQDAYVYRVDRSARVRVVPAALAMPTETHVALRLRDPAFDPAREILLLDAPTSIGAAAGSRGTPGTAAIVSDEGGDVVIDATAPQDGFLLLADMYYPGWKATVDGVDTPIYRANMSERGIALARGRHTVRFTYASAAFTRGAWISIAALLTLAAWFGAAVYGARP